MNKEQLSELLLNAGLEPEALDACTIATVDDKTGYTGFDLWEPTGEFIYRDEFINQPWSGTGCECYADELDDDEGGYDGGDVVISYQHFSPQDKIMGMTVQYGTYLVVDRGGDGGMVTDKLEDFIKEHTKMEALELDGSFGSGGWHSEIWYEV